jgi:hypothetical protein
MRVFVSQHQSQVPGKRLLRILDMLTSWAGLDMFAVTWRGNVSEEKSITSIGFSNEATTPP